MQIYIFVHNWRIRELSFQSYRRDACEQQEKRANIGNSSTCLNFLLLYNAIYLRIWEDVRNLGPFFSLVLHETHF